MSELPGDANGAAAGEALVRETLEALEMPAKGLRYWLAEDLHFCKGHGGERVYGELMAIIERHARLVPGATPVPGSAGERDGVK